MAATLEQVDLEAFVGPAASVVAHGDMKADSLRFGSFEATHVNCKLRLLAKQVFFSNIRAETYGGSATGELSFTLSGKNASFQTDGE